MARSLPSDDQRHTSGTPAGRLMAIGDIHGCLKPLSALLEAVDLSAGDTLVVLGDFTNRGPQTRGVIEQLLDLRGKIRLVTILGNHEEQMLDARRDPSSLAGWLSMGGQATLQSYATPELPQPSLSDIPSQHWEFLEAARAYWECENFFFTHAGYDPQLPLEHQSSLSLRWLSLSDRTPLPHCSGKTAIVGHTPNLHGRIVDFGFLRCLDTGCGLGGLLSLMDLHSGHLWQCPENSEKVIWS